MPSVRAHSEWLERRRFLTIEAATTGVGVDANDELVLQSAATASAPGASAVVAFSDRDSATGKGKDIFVRRFSAGGATMGMPIAVNTTTAGSQMNPDVAINASGAFVVVWQSENQDGDGWGIYARRFASGGVVQGTEILVNTMTGGAQVSPKVAIDNAGNFVVTYVNEAASDGVVLARRFGADGTPVAEVTVSAGGTKGYSSPTIAMKSDGSFAVAFVRTNLDTDNSTDIQIQAYTSAGTASGSMQTIADAGDQATPTLAAGSNFVLAWADASTSEASIFYRALTPSGTWSGTPVQANQDSLGNRTQPRVSVDANNHIVVGWTQQEQDTFYSSAVYRSFTSANVATSNEIAVGDGSSMRTLMDLAFVGNGAFVEVSVSGEFGGYGLGELTLMENVIRFNGTGAADQVVAYDLNADTLRTAFNGVTQNYQKNAYARVVADLQGGNDSILAGDASMMFTVSGGAGNDTILTGSAFDSVSGGDGNDSINAGGGSDYAIGNSGDDILYGGAGDDTLTGSGGKDTMYGGDGNDRIAGLGSPDRIFGEGGDDRLYGDDGDDRLDGGGGRDRLFGGENNDFLEGGSSNDGLYGQNGNDTLSGGKGNDFLAGDAGTDTVLGKEPGDTLVGVELS